jgi:hypothetical protein
MGCRLGGADERLRDCSTFHAVAISPLPEPPIDVTSILLGVADRTTYAAAFTKLGCGAGGICAPHLDHAPRRYPASYALIHPDRVRTRYAPIVRRYSRSHAAGMLSRGEYGPGA